MATFEIPLSPRPQTFSIDLAGKTYYLRFGFADAPEAGWFMDISDVNKKPLVCGLPLVTGMDLLDPYAYLGIGGKLFVLTSGTASADNIDTPGSFVAFTDLGVGSRLLFEPN